MTGPHGSSAEWRFGSIMTGGQPLAKERHPEVCLVERGLAGPLPLGRQQTVRCDRAERGGDGRTADVRLAGSADPSERMNKWALRIKSPLSPARRAALAGHWPGNLPGKERG